MLWQWQATMHLNGKGYKATLEGDNRDDATSGDATVRDEYVRKNGDLFREILRMLNAKSEAGKTLMLQIQDEFDNDHDGYGLWEYLKAWASSLTPAEVKVLKRRVEALKFSASETPEKWSYKMQLLLNMWKRIPADKRGGTIADLSDSLLDKVLEVPSCKSYTQYVKAFMDATFPPDLLAMMRLSEASRRERCFKEACVELPVRLGHHDKLALMGLLFSASYSDGSVDTREMRVLKDAGDKLGLDKKDVVSYLRALL